MWHLSCFTASITLARSFGCRILFVDHVSTFHINEYFDVLNKENDFLNLKKN